MPENGMDIEIPGIARVKNLKYFSEISRLIVTAALVSLALITFNHDVDASKGRASIVEQLAIGSLEQKQSIEELREEVTKQRAMLRLQTCIAYLSLSAEQKARTGRSEAAVCGIL